MRIPRLFLLAITITLSLPSILIAQNGPAPTAEDVLRALQRRRPMNEVIPPVGVTSSQLKKNIRKLLPEGWTIIDRTGRLEKQKNWWVFVYEPARGDQAMKVIPNAKLEQMVRTATHSDQIEIFTISGEVTVYQGKNYLLVRMAMRPPPVEKVQPTTVLESEQPETSPKETPDQSKDISIESSVEDVLSKMQELKPDQTMIEPIPQLQNNNLLEAIQGHTMIADGSSFVRRAGRLYQQSGWWMFTPESDHPDHPELPLKLLPNKNTDLMATMWKQNSIGLVYIVSGEVTLFQGVNYLLPLVAVRRIESVNLRK